MRSRSLLHAVGCGLLLAACDRGGSGDRAAAPAPTRAPVITVAAEASYAGLGGEVVDLALIPNAQPSLSRGIAALDSGGFAVIDFAQGETLTLDGPRVDFIAAAPDFELQGSPSPLLVAAGGALKALQAWSFRADEGALVDVPVDPIATDDPVRALCAERAHRTRVDLLVFTDASLERWRLSDRGEDRLAAKRVNTAPTEQRIVACAGLAGEVVGVTDGGDTRVLGAPQTEAWWLRDGSDVAGLVRSEGDWAIVARPSEAGVAIITPNAEEVEVRLVEGAGQPSALAPTLLAASPADFGGQFREGVLIVAQDDQVAAFGLGGLIASAKEAIDRSR
jgi:hypothetical protein